MKTKVTETIFSNKSILIPMSTVQHIEKRYCDYDGTLSLMIVTDKTKWNFQCDTWENAINIGTDKEAKSFLKCYCDYIAERDGMIEEEK